MLHAILVIDSRANDDNKKWIFNIVQLWSDGTMVLTYLSIATLWGELIYTCLLARTMGSTNLYMQSLAGPVVLPLHVRVCQPIALMEHKNVVCFFIVTVVEIVFSVLIGCLPDGKNGTEDRQSAATKAEHFVMSFLVLLSYLALLATSTTLSRIMYTLRNASVFARNLMLRILALGVPASVIGVLRAPYDFYNAEHPTAVTDKPVLLYSLAIFLRFVPCGLLTALMWPLPKYDGRSAGQQTYEGYDDSITESDTESETTSGTFSASASAESIYGSMVDSSAVNFAFGDEDGNDDDDDDDGYL